MLGRMARVSLFICALVLVGAYETNTKDVGKTEFGRHWDGSYTLKVDVKDVGYDWDGSEYSILDTYVYKRDKKLGKYQSWSKNHGLIAIERKDANGTIWRVSSTVV